MSRRLSLKALITMGPIRCIDQNLCPNQFAILTYPIITKVIFSDCSCSAQVKKYIYMQTTTITTPPYRFLCPTRVDDDTSWIRMTMS